MGISEPTSLWDLSMMPSDEVYTTACAACAHSSTVQPHRLPSHNLFQSPAMRRVSDRPAMTGPGVGAGHGFALLPPWQSLGSDTSCHTGSHRTSGFQWPGPSFKTLEISQNASSMVDGYWKNKMILIYIYIYIYIYIIYVYISYMCIFWLPTGQWLTHHSPRFSGPSFGSDFQIGSPSWNPWISMVILMTEQWHSEPPVPKEWPDVCCVCVCNATEPNETSQHVTSCHVR